MTEVKDLDVKTLEYVLSMVEAKHDYYGKERDRTNDDFAFRINTARMISMTRFKHDIKRLIREQQED